MTRDFKEQVMDTKVCTRCKEEKPVSGFYPRYNKSGVVDLRPECKACGKNLDKVRIGQRHKYRQEVRKRNAGKPKRKSKKSSEVRQRYREKHIDKHLARVKTKNAIKQGKLIRPNRCSKCQAKCRAVAHHEDYSKPLEVTWVCHECHMDIHYPVRLA